MPATATTPPLETIENRKLRLITRIAEIEDEVMIRLLEDIFMTRKKTKQRKSRISPVHAWAEPPLIKLDAAAFRQRLLNGPTWVEEDMKKLEENIKLFKNWTIEQW